MRPTRTLPNSYIATCTLDLSKDRRALLLLNLLGVPLTLVAALFFGWYIAMLRPELGDLSLRLEGLGGVLKLILGMVLTMAAAITIHELVHGVFFWLFTKSRPLFGFKGAYAYAAAPDWYLPRNQFLVVGLAPLVLLSVGGLLLVAVVPVGWLPALFIALVMNAGGAIGDLYVAALLLRTPPTTLTNDVGDAMTFYEPQA